MPSILVIDDREDQRTTLCRSILLRLPDGWHCAEAAPFAEMSDYLEEIAGGDEIAVLILDERLDEQVGSNEPVTYQGHELVGYLRQRLPTFPVFMVTSFVHDLEGTGQDREFEDVIERGKFAEDADMYVPRLIRAGQRFVDTHLAELAELSNLASHLARGEDVEGAAEHLAALQLKLGLAFGMEGVLTRQGVLEDIESTVADLAVLRDQLEQVLEEAQGDVEEDPEGGS